MSHGPRAFALVSGSLRYPLTPGDAVVGRSPDVTVSIADKAASREHALLRVSVDSVMVRDLGSSNGTYVNQRRILQPTPMEPGDSLVIGDTELTLAVDDLSGDDIWERQTAVPAEVDAGPTPVPPAPPPMPPPLPGGQTDVRAQRVLLLLDDRRWAKEIRRAATIHPNLEVTIDLPQNAREAIAGINEGLLLIDVGPVERELDQILAAWHRPHSRGPVLISSGASEEQGVVLARKLGVRGFVRRGKPAILVMAVFNYQLGRGRS